MVSKGAPVVSTGAPVVSTGAPVVSTGAPVVSTGTPVVVLLLCFSVFSLSLQLHSHNPKYTAIPASLRSGRLEGSELW